MAEHRPEQVLHVVGVQPGLRGLGAAGGDQVLLARRVKGGQVVLLFDLGDLLDHLASLGQQVHQLLVDAVDLLAQLVELGLVGRRLGGAGGGARAWFWGLLTHGAGVVSFSDWSSGPE